LQLKLLQIPITGTFFSVELGKLSQAFLLKKAGLITPTGDRYVHSSKGALFIFFKTHDIGQTLISHQQLDSIEQLKNVLHPEVRIPFFLAIKAAKAIKLQNRFSVMMC
jgi:hypothetical protein